jgi:hypothetical protein
MNQALQHHDFDVMEIAMSAYLLDASAARSKHNKIKMNMECRRKLEIKAEERQLERTISEFDFN